MNALDLIKQISRPSTLWCHDPWFFYLKDKISLPVKHKFCRPAIMTKACIEKYSADLLEVYNFSDGFELFYSPDGDEYDALITFFSISESVVELKRFRSELIRVSSIVGGYKSDILSDIDNYCLLAVVGNSSFGYLFCDSSGRIYLVNREERCDELFDIQDAEDQWDSINIFLNDFYENMIGFFGGYWRYTGENGVQYVVSGIEFT